jgi:hypothetical protein
MSDGDNNLFETDDFVSWYDGNEVFIEFIDDGVTKAIPKENFRDFYKFMSQTYDEFLRAEDEDDGEEEEN